MKEVWNWQLKEWPNFSYDEDALEELEHKFSNSSGIIIGAIKHINNEEKNKLIVEIMSNEALKTSEIEGEMLNRDSIQASIKRNLGLEVDKRRIPPEEYGISKMMVDIYNHHDKTLTHQQLFDWHEMLTNGRQDLNDVGKYRTHHDAMQIISGRIDKPKIHFEAPPSHKMQKEMEGFIHWFNDTHQPTNAILPLARAGIAHLYFVSIHPFEDGNGRIARAITEKSIALSIKRPTLLSISQMIQTNKKHYYNSLGAHNTTVNITNWLLYFGETILDAQKNTLKLIDFLIEKAKFFDQFANDMNERQLKVVKRLFNAGHQGFIGGLSAENYLRITQTSSSTATRDLQQMVNRGMLTRTGERKSTRYWLNLQNCYCHNKLAAILLIPFQANEFIFNGSIFWI